MGIEPIKPMTTTRFDFIKAKTPNVQHPTSNAQSSELSVERWAPARDLSELSVGR
jgi:hypothetical protein